VEGMIEDQEQLDKLESEIDQYNSYKENLVQEPEVKEKSEEKKLKDYNLPPEIFAYLQSDRSESDESPEEDFKKYIEYHEEKAVDEIIDVLSSNLNLDHKFTLASKIIDIPIAKEPLLEFVSDNLRDDVTMDSAIISYEILCALYKNEPESLTLKLQETLQNIKTPEVKEAILEFYKERDPEGFKKLNSPL
jgi:hypothetical protein